MTDTGALSPNQARARLRGILAGDACLRPASVYDPLSVRAAARLGFDIAMLGGSVAALAVLGAPDHALLSIDELAGLCRRICRAAPVPLIVDADHGFGPALHAMRTVQELESAGVAALTLEDTDLPRGFGAAASLISLAEAEGKLAAALSARRDPGLVIIGRTDGRLQDAAALVTRARAYAALGADAIFLTGVRDRDTLARARDAAGVPLIVPEPQGQLAVADLAALGVRICLTPHRTLPAATAAAWESLAAAPGADPAARRPENLMADLSEAAAYDAWIRLYLGGT